MTDPVACSVAPDHHSTIVINSVLNEANFILVYEHTFIHV